MQTAEAGTCFVGTSASLKLGLVLFLVAANGFFVAAEFALVGVRRSRIETLAAAGKSSAKRLLRLLNNLNAYLSASQLGITLASLGLGWVGEPVIARLLEQPFSGLSEGWRHGFAFAIAFSIITTLHIVLGEQAPKLFGLERAERVALATSLTDDAGSIVFSSGPFARSIGPARARCDSVGLQPPPNTPRSTPKQSCDS